MTLQTIGRIQQQLEFTNLVSIKIKAIGGASLSDCIREAIVVSAQQVCDVILVHNDKEYMVRWNELNKAVKYPG